MNLAGKSLLVVDDHDPTRNLLVNFLEGLGATVANASGGIDALKQMGDARFDLVLLDLRMDDMDGLAVLKKAKSEDLAKNYTRQATHQASATPSQKQAAGSPTVPGLAFYDSVHAWLSSPTL